MKHIVVPIDFSDCSLNALDVAVAMARKTPDCKVSMVHVSERLVYGVTLSLSTESVAGNKQREEVESAMKALIDDSSMSDVDVQGVFMADTDIREMLQDELMEDADMIVIGSHGLTGLVEEVLGSTAEKVLRFSKIPVLVIKGHMENFDVKDFVFASNFEKESYAGFAKLEAFAKLFYANIHLLKVITPSNFENSRSTDALLKEFIAHHGLEKCTTAVVNHHSVKDGIMQYCQDIGADVIAMETHGRTGLSHLIRGSITENVANHNPMPLLSVRLQ